MRYLILVLLLGGMVGCATGEPMISPWFAAETLSEKEVAGFEKIMKATQQRGCLKTRGNLAIYGQSGEWKKVSCYGVEPDKEGAFLEVLSTD